jgi:hypothetical protein
MSQVDSAREAPAAREAARLSPQAYARAEQLRARAERAFDDGDRAAAQILSEHALAAYTRAVVLSRLVKAQHELASAQQRLAKSQVELSALDEQLKRLSAEADDLEMRVKVARDAQPLALNTPSSPEREQARREAAAALAAQARLLCAATRLLDSEQPAAGELLTKLDALDKTLLARAGAAPIDEAIRLRSSCLRELSEVRRRSAPPGSGESDALLDELSKHGSLFPFRDDRGVVVTLRGLFAGADKLSSAAEERLALLGRVARAHANFPVLVVFHAERPGATATDPRRAELVVSALRRAGAKHVEVRHVAGTLPLVETKRGGAAERNERVEIVFISPA